MLTIILYYKQNLKYAENFLNEELVHASTVTNLYWFSWFYFIKMGHVQNPPPSKSTQSN